MIRSPDDGKGRDRKEDTDDEKGHSRCGDAWVLLHDEQHENGRGMTASARSVLGSNDMSSEWEGDECNHTAQKNKSRSVSTSRLPVDRRRLTIWAERTKWKGKNESENEKAIQAKTISKTPSLHGSDNALTIDKIQSSPTRSLQPGYFSSSDS
jgi:hypothetical protein